MSDGENLFVIPPPPCCSLEPPNRNYIHILKLEKLLVILKILVIVPLKVH